MNIVYLQSDAATPMPVSGVVDSVLMAGGATLFRGNQTDPDAIALISNVSTEMLQIMFPKSGFKILQGEIFISASASTYLILR